MFTGDLNARLGHMSDSPQEYFSPIDEDPLSYVDVIDVPQRCSMDEFKNPWGNNLIDMCTVHDMCLLNGRTLGDLKGHYTNFEKNGNSVIDITVVDKQLISNILSFNVHPNNEFSKHCLIQTKLACQPFLPTINETSTVNLKFKKYFWNQDTSNIKLSAALQSHEVIVSKNKILQNNYPVSKSGVNQLTADVVSLCTLLHEKSCDHTKIGGKRNSKRKKQPWYTPDCETLRKRVRRAGNYLNSHPFDRQSREEYFVAKRQYNRKIKQTKKAAREKSLTNLINSLDKRDTVCGLYSPT